MPQLVRNTGLLCLTVFSLCVIASASSEAQRTKNKTIVPRAKQASSVRTDLTPRNKNDCVAISNALNAKVKTLSTTTRQVVPGEFTRVTSDLRQSCNRGDFDKAWISIEWMNGCLDNFTKDPDLGFCSRNEGYSCAVNPNTEDCMPRR
jgi:hypothetical protein